MSRTTSYYAAAHEARQSANKKISNKRIVIKAPSNSKTKAVIIHEPTPRQLKQPRHIKRSPPWRILKRKRKKNLTSPSEMSQTEPNFSNLREKMSS